MERTRSALHRCLPLLMAGIAGCNSSQPTYAPRPPVVTAPQAPTTVVQQAPTISTESFNLGTVVGLLKSNQVSDADALQRIVNDPSSGINNVDVDGDGQIDMIAVQETQTGNGRRFEFIVYPSSQDGQNPTTVASVTLIVQGPQVVVQAGYPSYVAGYNSVYYNDYWTVRDILFLSWMLGPRPIYALRPYGYYRSYYHWGPRPVLAAPVLRSTRTTYETRTRVSPIRVSAPPPSYRGATATKMPSSFARPPAPTTSNLSDRSGQLRSFKVDSGPKPQATGFMPRPQAPAAPTVRSPAPPSSPFKAPTAPTFRAPSAPTFKPTAPSFRAPPPRPTFKPPAPAFRAPSRPSFRSSGGRR